METKIKIIKYQPQLCERATYFLDEKSWLKVLRKRMADDIKTNGTSDEFLMDECYQIGEATELEFPLSEAKRLIVELLNINNKN
tara:strand:+ start:305 stop:556 length:252 start_codon:yes stop_codon:yes gene_type:complete